jgi:hypothetical protein
MASNTFIKQTGTQSSPSGNPAGYKPALALATRYLAATLRLDAFDQVTLAVEIERRQCAAAMAATESAVTSQLMTCHKTGQPVGIMFNHCLSTHLPHSVAINWLAVSEHDIYESLIKTQPIASLVYLLTTSVFEGDSFAGQLRREGYGTVDSYVARTAAIASLYSGAFALLTAEEISGAIAVLIELQSYVPFGDLPSVLKPLRVPLMQGDIAATHAALLTVAADYYGRVLAKYAGQSRVNSFLLSPEAEMLDAVEALLRRARRGVERSEQDAVAMAHKKAAERVQQEARDIARNRKRSQEARASDTMMRGLAKVLGEALSGIITDAAEAAGHSTATVEVRPVANVDGDGGNGAVIIKRGSQAPRTFFNPFAVSGK